MKRKLILLFLIIGLTIFISACGGDNAVEDNSSTAPDSASQGSGVSANLDVTSGYGQESIFSGETAFDDSATVMDLLTKNVEVDSAYGGSFINGINGLISGYTGGKGEKKDWFFMLTVSSALWALRIILCLTATGYGGTITYGETLPLLLL